MTAEVKNKQENDQEMSGVENNHEMTEVESNHEKVLQDLNSSITDTKILVEKVMKMRLQCKELQMNSLRLFHPTCIKIMNISNELSGKSVNQLNKDKKKRDKTVKREG
ncbi:uncharacterized protein LOC100679851 isoform X1 [Nasonia vitripennis]|uniref:Uncharacterized protein n=1 Tax=Nasonia vitripennis TaxID=7425 RepID=A0A7M7GD13_NASVI|nr:uncharacterized protein LOC100679851 isoform X1 [Nasonia vitripennis]